jgi:hypothetical protein
MSIASEIERINGNVKDALAAAAEMGASVPENANSDDLGTLIRSIPQNAGGDGDYALPPLKLYAVKYANGYYYQEIVEGGATRTYTAAEIHELASQCTVTLETRTSVATDAKRGHFTYISSDIAEDGTVNSVLFSGYSEDYLSDPHFTEATLYPDGGIILNTRKWSPNSIDVDPTLTESGVPADAKTVGGILKALSEQINELKNLIQNNDNEGTTAILDKAVLDKTILA